MSPARKRFGPLHFRYSGFSERMNCFFWPTWPSPSMARAVMRQRVSESGMRKLKRALPSASVTSLGSQAAVSTSSRRGRSSTFTPRSLRLLRPGALALPGRATS